MDDGKCECYNGDKSRGVTFMGAHCEVRLKDDCRTIYSGESIGTNLWQMISDANDFSVS